MNKFDLEERLIEFSVLVIEITKEMPNNINLKSLIGVPCS